MILLAMIARRLLAVVLAMAFVLLGFGHQQGQTASFDPQLAAYLQAGGVMDDLCSDTDSPDPMAAPCPVCTLAQTMALPAEPVGLPQAVQPVRFLPFAFSDQRLVSHDHVAPPARGPPAQLT
jgi:hypothetical protein